MSRDQREIVAEALRAGLEERRRRIRACTHVVIEHMDPEQEKRIIGAITQTGQEVAKSVSVYVDRAQRGLDVETPG